MIRLQDNKIEKFEASGAGRIFQDNFMTPHPKHTFEPIPSTHFSPSQTHILTPLFSLSIPVIFTISILLVQ